MHGVQLAHDAERLVVKYVLVCLLSRANALFYVPSITAKPAACLQQFSNSRSSGVTSTDKTYHVGRTEMHPLKQRQHSDRPTFTISHSFGRSLKFSRPIFKWLGKEELSFERAQSEAYCYLGAQADTADRWTHHLDGWARVGSLMSAGGMANT